VGDGGIGLVIGLGADDSAAQAIFPQFSSAAVKATANAAGGLKELNASATAAGDAIRAIADKANPSLLSSRESARLLSEELGVRLPRGVTTALGEMLPAISSLGPAFLGVFAVMEIPKLIEGLKDASYWMEGFGKDAQAAFASAVKASDDAYTHFKDIKTGISLRDEVNQNIAALQTQRDVLDQTGGSALNYASAIAQLFQGNVAAASAYVAMARSQQLTTEQLAKLEKTRLEQLTRETQLEGDAGKARERRAREVAAETAKASSLMERLREATDSTDAADRNYAKTLAEITKLHGNYNQEVMGGLALQIRDTELAKEGAAHIRKQGEEAEKAAKLWEELNGKINQVPLALEHYIAMEQRIATVTDPATRAMLEQMNLAVEEKEAFSELAVAANKLDKALKIPPLPANFLTPLVEGTIQLTAAQAAGLPTEREIELIHRNLVKLFPEMTKGEVDTKAAELARNTGLIQLMTQTAHLTTDTKAYREEMQKVVNTIRDLSGLESAQIEKARESAITQQDLGQSFLQMGDATLHASAAAAIYGQNIGKAMEAAAKAAISSIAQQAAVNALNALAWGIYCVAQGIFGDPAAAAAAPVYFESAAEWGMIAGVAGAASAAIPGAGARGRAGATATAAPGGEYGAGSGGYSGGGGAQANQGLPPSTLAPGAARAGGRFSSGNLIVMVVGDAAAGEWLAGTLNRAVGRGVTLTSTSSERGSPVGH
jgi:hypothetical protein